MLQSLGIANRAKKLKRVDKRGKLEKCLEEETQSLQLLQELTNIDIDPQLLETAKKATKRAQKEGTENGNVAKKWKNDSKTDLNTSSASHTKKAKKARNKKRSGQENAEQMEEEEVLGGNTSELSEKCSDSDSEDDDSEPSNSKSEPCTSDSEKEFGGSDPDSPESKSPKVSLGKKQNKVNRSEPTKQKKLNQNGMNKVRGSSKTSEIRQIDLKSAKGKIEISTDKVVSDSEDEDFFMAKTKPKKPDRTSDFFLGGCKRNSEIEDRGSEESEDETKGQYDPSDDSGIIDTGKYFKRNLFRRNEDQLESDRGRGNMRGRGQIGERGRGSRRGWDGGRGRGRDGGRGGDRGRGGRRGWGGGRGGGRGRDGENRFGQKFNRSQNGAGDWTR